VSRFLRFNIVGAAGIGVQVFAVWLLADRMRLPISLATVAAVGAAVVHNYCWHRVWTWADRQRSDPAFLEFLLFAGANGLVSLAGNVAIVTALTAFTRVGAVPASLIAIASCGVVNYWVADRAVFAGSKQPRIKERSAVRTTSVAEGTDGVHP
jgi:putative flippase GtrA